MLRSSALSLAILAFVAGVIPRSVTAGEFDFEATASFPGALGEIPDEGVQFFPVQISPKVDFIASLELEIQGLSHEFAEDLDLYLVAPFDGLFIELMTDLGGSSPIDNATLIFRDSGAAVPPTPIPGGPAVYMPEGLFEGKDGGFGDFLGFSSGAGPWLLLAIDDAPEDTGRINGITIRGTVPEPTVLSLLLVGGLALLRRRKASNVG
jgi:hypothetical protein